MFVMLRKDWPGKFRRVLRDAEGKPLTDDDGQERVLVFEPGDAIELTDDEYAAVMADVQTDPKVSRPLVHVRRDEKGRTRVVDLEKDGEPDDAPRTDVSEDNRDPLAGDKPRRRKR